MPGLRPAQIEDGAHQHRLAGAGPADDADDLAAAYVQIEILVHDLVTEDIGQPAHANRQLVGVGPGRAHQSISMKNSAASASSRITSEIVCTTLEVVRSPTDSAVPW